MKYDLLIRRACIHDDAPLEDIAIRGGKIAKVEAGIQGEASSEIDAEGHAVIPGLIESHLHLDKALLHRRLPARQGSLEEAIRLTSILKGKQEREDVMARSRTVLDMAVRNGTTAIRAHSDVDLIQGLIGIETLLELRDEYRDLLDLQIVAFPQEGILKSPGTHELLVEAMEMGADVIGGCPYCELNRRDTEAHIDAVFDLAERYDAPIDMHADFSDDTTDPRFVTAEYIAHKTIERGWQERVALGHVTNLGSLSPSELKPVIELLREAGITIVTLPATDLYLNGRNDERNQRRGLAPVRALHQGGVNVAYSSNNVRNAFTPFGKADMLQIGNMLAHLVQFGTPDHQAAILDMGTRNAARAIGLGRDYGIRTGCTADIVILDTFKVADALLDIPPRLWVIKRGKITVATDYHCAIRKGSATR